MLFIISNLSEIQCKLFCPRQHIPTVGASKWEHFIISGYHFIAQASYHSIKELENNRFGIPGYDASINGDWTNIITFSSTFLSHGQSNYIYYWLTSTSTAWNYNWTLLYLYFPRAITNSLLRLAEWTFPNGTFSYYFTVYFIDRHAFLRILLPELATTATPYMTTD